MNIPYATTIATNDIGAVHGQTMPDGCSDVTLTVITVSFVKEEQGAKRVLGWGTAIATSKHPRLAVPSCAWLNCTPSAHAHQSTA